MEHLSASVACERRDDAALLWIDNPPVNAISQSVRAGLMKGLATLAADPIIAAIVILCRGRTFSSGADITEFGAAEQEPFWVDLDRKIENSVKPVIAAIHGHALGGGLEIALACHYRVATGASVLALPEVKLGLIPGAGGTQRLPRLIGIEKAIDIITSGRHVPAAEALSLGLIDEIAGGDIAEAAVAFARRKARNPLPKASLLPLAPVDTAGWSEARARIAARYRGFAAPLRALDAIACGAKTDFATGWKAEAALFEECLKTEEHASLSYLFFAERQARKLPQSAGTVSVRSLEKVAVIGGGTMGTGISLSLAQSGLPVVLIERDGQRLADAKARITQEIDAAEKRGRITCDEARRRNLLITGSTHMADAVGSDLVIEAVFEDMTLKRQIFAELDRVASGNAILASNTSGLDLDEIARATRRPDRIVGLHFFSPAHVMSLLEIVKGRDTAPDVLATALSFAKRLGKQPVIAGVCDGFIANRLFDQYFREADFLIEEGTSPYEVDAALTSFGMPMGPFAVSDLVGLDVGQLIRKRQRTKLAEGVRYSTLEDEIAALGRLGRKAGKGWYLYADGSRQGEPDPQVLSVIERHRATIGLKPRQIAPEEIVQRCLFALINEGGKLIEEGIAQRASDIDVAAVHGYGFPRYRGGPMRFADRLGLAQIAKTVETYFHEQGTWWRPSALILERAQKGQSLTEAA